MKNTLDHDRVVVHDVEDQVMPLCDLHARSILFAERVPSRELDQETAMRPQFVNEPQRGFRTVRGDIERNL